ncbi:MAG: regulatory protein RecX [Alphaproteobacteria bacterium]|nr:regulatory protein RecX [Alphaproteobacteria bacterium]
MSGDFDTEDVSDFENISPKSGKNMRKKSAYKSGDKRKQSKPITAARLNNIALYYLERFSSSAENLRRVLARRIEKSVYEHGTDKEEGLKAVDEIVERFVETGLLNDQLYARSVAFSQHRAGKSQKAIRMKLASKGVASDVIDAAMSELQEEIGESSELQAALSYVRKRRLGPYRIKNRDEKKEKDLAALARQGFSYDICRQAIEIETIDELEAMRILV